MKTYLKVKIKTLAAEAQIIRREERRWERRIYLGTKYNSKLDREEPRYKVVRNHPVRVGLVAHRKTVVRHEARLSQLAYAYLRGRDLLATDEAAARSFKRSTRSNTGLWRNEEFQQANNHWALLSSGDLTKIRDMIERFGGNPDKLVDWFAGDWPEVENF